LHAGLAALVLVFGTGAAQAALITLEGQLSEFRVRESAALQTGAPAELKDVFHVRVEAPGAVPMAGSYRLDKGVLSFKPLFPLEPGVTYRAEYRLGAETAVASFVIPKPERQATTEIQQVFPTARLLPENQLKLYIQFSAPMSRGAAFQRIHVYDQSGIEVRLPFLRLAEELWDSEYKRLTVLFDPGRIKRGLVPNQELGMALHEGRSYRLVIDKDWPDAHGVPLKANYTREFSVGPEDRTPLDPKDWSIGAPQAGTRDAVTISFPEALDHALLTRVITVADASGRSVEGSVTTERDDTLWRFTPARAWNTGAYNIKVPGILEDLAGNKVYTPFDVDVTLTPNAPGPSKLYDVPFTVGAR
jgi:hypothetical protein